MLHTSLTLTIFAVIISSLAVPVFAEPYIETYPNCAMLSGFKTNADDSTGNAKECLDNAPIKQKNPSKNLLTLSEITQYCSQFNADSTFEKNCINDYDTYEKIDLKATLIIITIILLISGMGTMLVALFCDDLFDTTKLRICVAAMGFVVLLITIAIMSFHNEIVASRFPPLV